MNFLDDYTAYNKVTSGFKIGDYTPVNSYILIRKIIRIVNRFTEDNPELTKSVLSKPRISHDEVLGRFNIKLNKLTVDLLKKVYEDVNEDILETVNKIVFTDIKNL